MVKGFARSTVHTFAQKMSEMLENYCQSDLQKQLRENQFDSKEKAMGSDSNWYQVGKKTCYIPKLAHFL